MTPRTKIALRWIFSIAMLVAVVLYGRTINWTAAWFAIRSASWPILLVATLVNFITLGAKAVTWWIFLRAVGVPSLSLAVKATVAGAGLNNILVANSGEAARVVFVTRASGAPSAAVLAALALERLFDLIGYIALMASAAYFLPMPHEVARWRFAAVGVLLGMIVLFGVLLRRSPGIVAATVYPSTLVGRVRTYLDRFMVSVRSILTLQRICLAMLLSLVNWAAQIATYHLVAVAAHFPISIVGSVTTLITANVGFLVRATPGNVGVFQVVYGVTAEALGLDKASAVAVALLLQLIQNLPVTLLAIAIAPDLLLHWRDKRGTAAPDGTRKRRASDSAA
ncbi:MAG TPA: lysylphosphatidylglycerol synthase transmembrane domain-containing protein [Gemmatimonadaceae bacterium]|nr:lysylphosphatidylglycerol synthase transmembrane domain-containing protein [Gemmatimonadaceae bacterium]